MFNGKAAKCHEPASGTKEDRLQNFEGTERGADYYRFIFENARDIILLIRHDETILEANKAAVDTYGYSYEELLDIKISQLRHNADKPLINLQMERAYNQGILFETVHLRKDGSIFPVEVSSMGITVDGERVLLSIIRDITERKLAQELLHSAYQRLQDIIEFLPDATFVINTEKGVIAWNRAMEKMTGIPKADIMGKGDYCYALPFYGMKRPILIDMIFESRSGIEKKYEYIDKHGNALFAEVFSPAIYGGKGAYLWLTASPLYDDKGNLTGAIQSIRDITERKIMEKELWRHREELESLVEWRTNDLIKTNEQLRNEINKREQLQEEVNHFFNLSVDSFIIITFDGRIKQMNPVLATTLGYRFEELVTKTSKEFVYEFIHPDDRRMSINAINECIAGKPLKGFENRFRCKDGTYRWFSWSAMPSLDTGQIYLVARDITGSKEVEEELKESNQRVINILESITDAFCTLDRQWRYTYINSEAERLYGVNRVELLGKCIWEVFPSPVGTVFYHECHKAQILKTAVHFEAYSKLFKKWLEVHAYPSREGLSFYFRDISQRKQAEEILRLSEERFSKAFHASPTMMIILTLKDLRFVDVNNNFLQTLGYKREEVIDRTPTELNIWLDLKDGALILKELRKDWSVRGYESRLRKKGDSEGTFLIYLELIEIDGEQCVLGSLIDVTEKKKLEKEIAHLERMNLVGEMAAGIAHEIRNPMTAVRGFLQMLENKTEFNSYKEYFSIMIGELDRANSIITEYLSLAKNKTVQFDRKNINSILKALEPLISADAMRSGSFLKMELADVPDLYLNDKEIRQLILNVTRNGLEAMPPGEELTIKTFEENEEVKLLIRDHGKGIEPEALDKIGTPFFTTKDNGTGLGLAVCFGIVRRHKAAINIESGSWGTAVTISFNANLYSEFVNFPA